MHCACMCISVILIILKYNIFWIMLDALCGFLVLEKSPNSFN